MARQYYQGKFTPEHPEKYYGDVKNIIYRSSWELKFFKYCDNTKSVVKWNSEEVVIPYRSPLDGKLHRYFTDFYMERLEDGKIVKYLGEIKPYSQTQKPKIPKRRTRQYLEKMKTYLINEAKWESAYKYCKQNDINFALITENHPILK
jgi:hypothetical protein